MQKIKARPELFFIRDNNSTLNAINACISPCFGHSVGKILCWKFSSSAAAAMSNQTLSYSDCEHLIASITAFAVNSTSEDESDFLFGSHIRTLHTTCQILLQRGSTAVPSPTEIGGCEVGFKEGYGVSELYRNCLHFISISQNGEDEIYKWKFGI